MKTITPLNELHTEDDALSMLARGTADLYITRIFPTAAAALLEANTLNRRINKRRVGVLAESLRRGGWMLTNDAVVLDWDGRVSNGQHRLTACVEAGEPIDVILMVGSDPALRDVIDTGMKRSFANALSLHDEVNVTQLAAAVSLHFRYENGLLVPGRKGGYLNTGPSIGGPGTYQPSHDTLFAHLAANSGLRDAVVRANAYRHHLPQLKGAAGAALDYITSRIDPYLSETFLNSIARGENLRGGMPEYALRRRLTQGHDTDPLSSEYQLSLGIKAWNFRRADDNGVHTLVTRSNESYPRAK